MESWTGRKEKSKSEKKTIDKIIIIIVIFGSHEDNEEKRCKTSNRESVDLFALWVGLDSKKEQSQNLSTMQIIQLAISKSFLD